MKRITLILILVLLVVHFSLSFLARNSELAAEKEFFRTMKTYEQINQNPHISPPAMISTVENGLKNIIEYHPQGQTAEKSQFILARFLIDHKKYPQAHAVLDQLSKKYEPGSSRAARVHFLKALAYEQEDLWQEALREYEILRDKYSQTKVGLTVPLYIGNHYSDKEMYFLATQAYEDAVLFYEELEKENRRRLLGYTAAKLLLQTHLKLQDYEKAGQVVEQTINNYPSLVTFKQQLPQVELIFARKLNQPEKAIEIYQDVKQKTDSPQLIKALEKRITALEQEK